MKILEGRNCWRQASYSSITHGMQLNETARLKSAWNQHKISSGCYHMGQRNIELCYSPGFVRVFYLQLFKLLLHRLFASPLRKLQNAREDGIQVGFSDTTSIMQENEKQLPCSVLTRTMIWTFSLIKWGMASIRISEPFCSSSLPMKPMTGMSLSTGNPTSAWRASFNRGFASVT